MKGKIEIPNSGSFVSESEFIRYIERKVTKTISNYDMIKKGDKIGVACSGGKDSISLLYILNKIRKKKNNIFDLEAITINEGIKGYRNETIKYAKEFCKLNNIKLHIYTYEKEFGKSLDKMLKKINSSPCNLCGTFRRNLLNKYSKKLKFTKLATGHNLDDESQSILMNYFKNNSSINARLGPITGIIKDVSFIPRIKPLYFLSEKEIAIYAFLKKFKLHNASCPNAKGSFRADVQELLNDFESKYSGTKSSLINSFLEILPILKEKYKKNAKLKLCNMCSEPSTKNICNSCSNLKKLKFQ